MRDKLSMDEVIKIVMNDDRLSQGAKNLYIALLTLEANGAGSITFKDGRTLILGEKADELIKSAMN